MKQRCVILVGRLISHPCARATDSACARCGLPICQTHRSANGICVVCSGEHVPPKGTTQIGLAEMLSFDGDEIGSFDAGGETGLHDYES